MSYLEAYNQAPQYQRENSLPTYEEAVASVHRPATIHEHPTTVSSGNFHYNWQPDYTYAQATRPQVAEISSRIPDVRVHVQSSSALTSQLVAEGRRRALREQERRNRWKRSLIVTAILVTFGIIIIYCTNRMVFRR